MTKATDSFQAKHPVPTVTKLSFSEGNINFCAESEKKNPEYIAMLKTSVTSDYMKVIIQCSRSLIILSVGFFWGMHNRSYHATVTVVMLILIITSCLNLKSIKGQTK